MELEATFCSKLLGVRVYGADDNRILANLIKSVFSDFGHTGGDRDL